MMRRMAEVAGRPLTCLLLQIGGAPELWRGLRDDIHAMNAAGVRATGQVGCRPVGILMGWDLSTNPFLYHPTYQRLLETEPTAAGRVACLQQSAQLREQLLSEHCFDPHAGWRPMGAPPQGDESAKHAFHGFMDFALTRISELVSPQSGGVCEYEPDLSRDSIAARAAAAGESEQPPSLADPRPPREARRAGPGGAVCGTDVLMYVRNPFDRYTALQGGIPTPWRWRCFYRVRGRASSSTRTRITWTAGACVPVHCALCIAHYKLASMI